MKRIYFSVTNDLSYDQRMHRICGSLASADYEVVLVGRRLKNSIALQNKTFRQVRLKCLFSKGLMFYAEYNLRLFFFLLFRRMDAVCAIDLDTILPCLFVSKLKKIPRVYDAHEYFTELKEVRTRPFVKKIWSWIERFAVPRFRYGYTVSGGLVDEFKKKYGRNFLLVRNFPLLKPLPEARPRQKYLLYQGAVNEARGFEYLIPAMKEIPHKLVICGDGNFMQKLKRLIRENGVEDKVELRGMLLPQHLMPVALEAGLGMGLAEKEGTNQFLALPNKFLDYMHAGLPQLSMAFPEYERINAEYEVAVLLPDLSPGLIANTVNKVLADEQLLQRLNENALKGREIFCWQREEESLINYYRQIFQHD